MSSDDIEQGFTVSNTWFEKDQKHLCTFRSAATPCFGQHLSTSKYAQIDFVLAQHHWKNSIKDVFTTDALAINSDRKLIFTTIRTKLACKKPDSIEVPTRY